MTSRNGRNDTTVYRRPSTKNVVAAIDMSETMPQTAATRCIGILIGSRATSSGPSGAPKRRYVKQDHDPDEQHPGDGRAEEREKAASGEKMARSVAASMPSARDGDRARGTPR